MCSYIHRSRFNLGTQLRHKFDQFKTDQNFHFQAKRRQTCAPLSAYVPQFPRIGGDTITREWLAPKEEASSFINAVTADDINKLLLPDIRSSIDVSSVLLFVALAIAFFYWEGGELIEEWKDDQIMEQLEEEYLEQQRNSKKDGDRRSSDLEAYNRRKTEKLLKERRRGLGWLALVTAMVLWTTGVVSNITLPYSS